MKNTFISKNNVPNEFKKSQLYKNYFNENQNNEKEIYQTYPIPENKKYFNEVFIKNYKNNSIENKANLLHNLIETYQYWEPNFNNSIKMISKKLFNFIYDNKEEIKNIIKKDTKYLFKYKLKILKKYRKYILSGNYYNNINYSNNNNSNNEITKKSKNLFFFIEKLKLHKNSFIQKIINGNEDKEKDKNNIKIKIDNAIENFIMNPILIIIEIMINVDDEDYCKIFSSLGFLSFLKYSHEKKLPWNSETCSYASKYGHLNCLKYAHENGCPWNFSTTSYAIKGENLDCLKYIIENNGPWNKGFHCQNIVNEEIKKYLKEKKLCDHFFRTI